MSNETMPTSIDFVFSIASPLHILIWIATIGACFAYGFGFIGNILSLIVFYSQEEFRRISTGLLFLLITLSNFVHLWTLVIEFLTIYNIVMFRNVFFQCRLTFFIQNVSRAMSTYFMVTVALDRLIRSELPIRSKQICTKRNTLKLTMIYFIIFSLFWSFFLYPTSSLNLTTGLCTFSQTAVFNYFYENIYFPVRAIFICLVPVVIMLSANIRMLINIRRSKRRVTNAPTVLLSENNIPLPSVSNLSEKKRYRMSAVDRMLFYMMLANGITFIISQIPFHIYSSIRNSINGLEGFTGSLIRALLLIWSSLYFGVAFYFYCLASPLFRQQFTKMIKKMCSCQTIPGSTMNLRTNNGL